MDYRNNWNWWLHQFWSALATNPSYYYYYTAKTALLNQSIMVRKNRSSRVHRRGIAEMPSSAATKLIETMGTPNETFDGPNKKRVLLNHCPQCATPFNDASNRQCKEKCGHVKCRSCFIRNVDGCPQCVEDARLRSLELSRSLGSGSETAVSSSYPSLLSIEDASNQRRSLRGLKKSRSPLRDEEPGTSQVVPITNGISGSKEYCQPTIDFSTIQEITAPTVDPIYSSDLNCQPEFGLADYPLSEDPLMNNDYSNRFRNQVNYNSSFLEQSLIPNRKKSWTETDSNISRRNCSADTSKSSQSNHLSSLGNPSSKGLVTRAQLKELPPDSTSSSTRKSLKRKSSRELMTRSPDIVTEIHHKSSPANKSDLSKSESPLNKKLSTSHSSPSPEKYARQKSNEKPETSSKSSHKIFRLGPQDREEKKNAAIANIKLNKSAVHKKSAARIDSEKNKPGASSSLKSLEPQTTASSTTSKDKPSRLSSLRSSTSFKIPQIQDSHQQTSSAPSKNASSNKSNASSVRLKNSPGKSESTPGLVKEGYVLNRSPAKPSSTLQSASVSTSKLPSSSKNYVNASKSSNNPDMKILVNSIHKSKNPVDSMPGTSKGSLRVIDTSDNEAEPSSEVKGKKKRKPVLIYDHITIIPSHNGDPIMYECNVCRKKFKTKAHIKYHEFCQNGNKPYKCDLCGQGFIAKSHFEYHLRTHTGERPYVCPKCGKGFNQRGKVTRHMRSHTGEKPFVCEECNRGFANMQALKSHFLIHTGERPFACEYCEKRFTGMTNLKKHVITHTGERPFMCTHCGKSFGLKWTLDLHLRTHSSERPYVCDQCTRAFSNSKDLRRHLVIHSGERPFKCWICGTAFRRKDNLDRHIKNTHNQPREVAKQLANEAAAEYLALKSSKSYQEKKDEDQNPKTTNPVQTTTDEPSCLPVKIPLKSKLQDAASSKKLPAIEEESATATEDFKRHSTERPRSEKSSESKRIREERVRLISNSPQYACQQCTEEFSNSRDLTTHLKSHTDSYILPNNQTDIPKGSLQFEYAIDNSNLRISCVDVEGLTELLPVPTEEYQSTDGLHVLESSKTANTEEEASANKSQGLQISKSDSEIAESIAAAVNTLDAEVEGWESDPLPSEKLKKEGATFDASNEMYVEEEGFSERFISETTTQEQSNDDQDVTVTVVYGPDGTTHFIADDEESKGSSEDKSEGEETATHVLGLPSEISVASQPFMDECYTNSQYQMSPSENDIRQSLSGKIEESSEECSNKESSIKSSSRPDSPEEKIETDNYVSHVAETEANDALPEDNFNDMESEIAIVKVVSEQKAEKITDALENETLKDGVDEENVAILENDQDSEETANNEEYKMSKANFSETKEKSPNESDNEAYNPESLESTNEENNLVSEKPFEESHADVLVEECNELESQTTEEKSDVSDKSDYKIENQTCEAPIIEVDSNPVMDRVSRTEEEENDGNKPKSLENTDEENARVSGKPLEKSTNVLAEKCCEIESQSTEKDSHVHNQVLDKNDDKVDDKTCAKDVNEAENNNSVEKVSKTEDEDNEANNAESLENANEESIRVSGKLSEESHTGVLAEKCNEIKSQYTAENSVVVNDVSHKNDDKIENQTCTKDLKEAEGNTSVEKISSPEEEENAVPTSSKPAKEKVGFNTYLDYDGLDDISDDELPGDSDDEVSHSDIFEESSKDFSPENKAKELSKSFLNDVSCIISGSLSKLISANNFSANRNQQGLGTAIKSNKNDSPVNGEASTSEKCRFFSRDSSSKLFLQDTTSKMCLQESSSKLSHIEPLVNGVTELEEGELMIAEAFSDDDCASGLSDDDSSSKLSNEDLSLKLSIEECVSRLSNDTSIGPLIAPEVDNTLEEGELTIIESDHREDADNFDQESSLSMSNDDSDFKLSIHQKSPKLSTTDSSSTLSIEDTISKLPNEDLSPKASLNTDMEPLFNGEIDDTLEEGELIIAEPTANEDPESLDSDCSSKITKEYSFPKLSDQDAFSNLSLKTSTSLLPNETTEELPMKITEIDDTLEEGELSINESQSHEETDNFVQKSSHCKHSDLTTKSTTKTSSSNLSIEDSSSKEPIKNSFSKLSVKDVSYKLPLDDISSKNISEVHEKDQTNEVHEVYSKSTEHEKGLILEIHEEDSNSKEREETAKIEEEELTSELNNENASPKLNEEYMSAKQIEEDLPCYLLKDELSSNLLNENSTSKSIDKHSHSELSEEDLYADLIEKSPSDLNEEDNSSKLNEENLAPTLTEKNLTFKLTEVNLASNLPEENLASKLSEENLAPKPIEENLATKLKENMSLKLLLEECVTKITNDTCIASLITPEANTNLEEGELMIIESDHRHEGADTFDKESSLSMSNKDSDFKSSFHQKSSKLSTVDSSSSILIEDTASKLPNEDLSSKTSINTDTKQLFNVEIDDIHENELTPEIHEKELTHEVHEKELTPKEQEKKSDPEVHDNELAPEEQGEEITQEVHKGDLISDVHENLTAEVNEEDSNSKVDKEDFTFKTQKEDLTLEINKEISSSKFNEEYLPSAVNEDDVPSKLVENDLTSKQIEDDLPCYVLEDELSSSLLEEEYSTSKSIEKHSLSELSEEEDLYADLIEKSPPDLIEDDISTKLNEENLASKLTEENLTSKLTEETLTPKFADENSASRLIEETLTSKLNEDNLASKLTEETAILNENTSKLNEENSASKLNENLASELNEKNLTSELDEKNLDSELNENNLDSELNEKNLISELDEKNLSSELNEKNLPSELIEKNLPSELIEKNLAVKLNEDLSLKLSIEECVSRLSNDPSIDPLIDAEVDNTFEEGELMIIESENDDEGADKFHSVPSLAMPNDDSHFKLSKLPTEYLSSKTSLNTEMEPLFNGDIDGINEKVCTPEKEMTPEVLEKQLTPEVLEKQLTPEVLEKELTPEVHEQELSPEVHETDLTPEVHEKESTPEVQEKELTSEVLEKETTHEVLEKELAPEIQEKELTPEVLEKDLTPEVQQNELTNDIQEKELSHEVKEKELSPEVQEKELSPEIQEKELTPEAHEEELTHEVHERGLTLEVSEGYLQSEVHEKEITPEEHEDGSNSTVRDEGLISEVHDKELTSETHEKELTSEIHEKELTPEIHEKELTPEMHEKELTPEIHEKELTPEMHEKELTPEIEEERSEIHEKELSPEVHEIDLIPGVHGTDLIPKIQDNKLSHTVHEKNLVPVVHEQDLAPAVHKEELNLANCQSKLVTKNERSKLYFTELQPKMSVKSSSSKGSKNIAVKLQSKEKSVNKPSNNRKELVNIAGNTSSKKPTYELDPKIYIQSTLEKLSKEISLKLSNKGRTTVLNSNKIQGNMKQKELIVRKPRKNSESSKTSKINLTAISKKSNASSLFSKTRELLSLAVRPTKKVLPAIPDVSPAHVTPLVVVENDDAEESGSLVDDVSSAQSGTSTKTIRSREIGQQTEFDPEFEEPLSLATRGIVPGEEDVVSPKSPKFKEAIIDEIVSSHSERNVGTQFKCPLKAVENKIEKVDDPDAKDKIVCDFDFSKYFNTLKSRESHFGRKSPVSFPDLEAETKLAILSPLRPKRVREYYPNYTSPTRAIEEPPRKRRRKSQSKHKSSPALSNSAEVKRAPRQDVRNRKRKLSITSTSCGERTFAQSFSSTYEDVRNRGLIYSQASTTDQNSTVTSPSVSSQKYFVHPKMADIPPGSQLEHCGVQFICDNESYSCPINPANIHFVRANGEQPSMESDKSFGEDVQVLYAAAAATMDPQDGSSGPPAKLRLLYAEAIGIQKQKATTESDQVQLYYAATTPNQDIGNVPNPHIRLDHPRLINAAHVGGEGEQEQLQVIIAPHGNYTQNAVPLPVEVSYNGNTAVAQSVVRKDENISLISRARAMHHWYPSITAHPEYHLSQEYSLPLSTYQLPSYSLSSSSSNPPYSVDTIYTSAAPEDTNSHKGGRDPSGKWKSSHDDHNFCIPTDTRSYLMSRGLTTLHSAIPYTSNNAVTSGAGFPPSEGIRNLSKPSDRAKDGELDSSSKWKSAEGHNFDLQRFSNSLDPTKSTSSLNTLANVVAYVKDTNNDSDVSSSAARNREIQAETDAVARAAAAIAAVGRAAREQRLKELQERRNKFPHRGPRKQYLSESPNFPD